MFLGAVYPEHVVAERNAYYGKGQNEQCEEHLRLCRSLKPFRKQQCRAEQQRHQDGQHQTDSVGEAYSLSTSLSTTPSRTLGIGHGRWRARSRPSPGVVPRTARGVLAGGTCRPVGDLLADGGLAGPVLDTSGESALFFVGVLVVALLGGVAPAALSAMPSSLGRGRDPPGYAPGVPGGSRATRTGQRRPGATGLFQFGVDRVKVDVDGVVAMADAGLLERVLANLIDNALRYADDSVVRVNAGRVGDRVLINVIDEGRGIPREAADRLSESFQRLGDHDNTRGVGLGMSVARGFVEAMGGTTQATDTPGGGLTVMVDLPAADGSGPR